MSTPARPDLRHDPARPTASPRPRSSPSSRPRRRRPTADRRLHPPAARCPTSARRPRPCSSCRRSRSVRTRSTGTAPPPATASGVQSREPRQQQGQRDVRRADDRSLRARRHLQATTAVTDSDELLTRTAEDLRVVKSVGVPRPSTRARTPTGPWTSRRLSTATSPSTRSSTRSPTACARSARSIDVAHRSRMRPATAAQDPRRRSWRTAAFEIHWNQTAPTVAWTAARSTDESSPTTPTRAPTTAPTASNDARLHQRRLVQQRRDPRR